MIDLHTHHRRCGHARGDLVDYVHAAVDLGLETLGLSDHAPLLVGTADEPRPGMHMPRSAFGPYLDEAVALQRREHRLEVLVGVEADYVAGTESAYARAAAATGLFDVMAHIDAIKGLGHHASRAIDDAWDETVQVLADTGVAVEINTSGYRKCGEPFPSWAVVERLHAAGVPLTYGSDAHRPDELHHAWADVRAGLDAIGVTQLAVVRGRRRSMMPLRGPGTG